MSKRAAKFTEDELHDLEDLGGRDEEEDELVEEGGKGPREDANFLPDYDMVRMTIVDLHNLIHEGYIDLDPEYQREVVWPDSKQVGLIDSIMNNFYIPPVIFSIKREIDEDSGVEMEMRICMDGKQRLTSIQRFLDGMIPYVSQQTGIRYWYQTPEGKSKKYTPLPDSLKEMFSLKTVNCVQYFELPSNMEREIFRRVQNGVALTAAEKMQAIDSSWAAWVRLLQKQYIDEGLSQSIKWSQKRGQDFQCVAQIVFGMYSLPNFTFPHAVSLDKWLRKDEEPTSDFKAEVHRVFADYLTISGDDRYNYGFRGISQRVSPVEVVMIGILLAWMKDCGDAQKAEEINNLRRETRKNHVDVRSNTKVIKFMWGMISRIKVPKQTKFEDSAPSKKRKRTTKQIEDGEYRPRPGAK